MERLWRVNAGSNTTESGHCLRALVISDIGFESRWFSFHIGCVDSFQYIGIDGSLRLQEQRQE